MGELRSREADLHYEERGQGRPIVLLHGVWMSGRFFERQLRTGIPGCRRSSSR